MCAFPLTCIHPHTDLLTLNSILTFIHLCLHLLMGIHAHLSSTLTKPHTYHTETCLSLYVKPYHFASMTRFRYLYLCTHCCSNDPNYLSFLSHYLTAMHPSKNTSMLFVMRMSITAKLKSSKMLQQWNKVWYMYKILPYATIKSNRLLKYTTWSNLQETMLNEKSLSAV